MSFTAIACLDFWEEVLYREVIAEHPHWPLLRIHRIGGLCVGLRVHAERVVRRFVEFAIIYTIPREERLLAECANMRAMCLARHVISELLQYTRAHGEFSKDMIHSVRRLVGPR